MAMDVTGHLNLLVGERSNFKTLLGYLVSGRSLSWFLFNSIVTEPCCLPQLEVFNVFH